MSETTFTFRVDSELKERFSELAREHDRPGSQLLRDFMRSFVAQRAGGATYEPWFRQQVQSALDDSAPAIPSKTVEQHFAKRRTTARRKAARKR